MQERDYVSATALLSRGADYAAANRSEYTKILFLLSKGMVRHAQLQVLQHVFI